MSRQACEDMSRQACENKSFEEFVMCVQSHKNSVLAAAQHSTFNTHPCVALLQKDLLRCASMGTPKTVTAQGKKSKKTP
jgi:hypothetical protein